MIIIILAAISMIAQDICEVLKDQSQARNQATLAGIFDSIMYLVLFFSLGVGYATFRGHSDTLKVAFLIFITAANFIGQYSGVKIGKRYIKETYEH
jgi:hypothetical protein